MLIKKPTLRNAICARPEGHAIDADLHLAATLKVIAQPLGVKEVVAIVTVVAGEEPIFELPDPRTTLIIHVDAECIERERANAFGVGTGCPAAVVVITKVVIHTNGTADREDFERRDQVAGSDLGWSRVSDRRLIFRKL